MASSKPFDSNNTMETLMKQMMDNGLSKNDTDYFFNVSSTFYTEHMLDELDEQLLCDLDEFYTQYGGVHGYLSLIVCIFGVITNILNIIVLTRDKMNGSPINRILTGIAVADMLVMIDYIPFSIHRYQSQDVKYSWSWSAIMWFHAHFSTVIHTVSVWLTLSIAVWRFIMIQFHTLAPVYCTMKRCHILLVAAYVAPLFLVIPNLFTFTIANYSPDGGNTTIYHLNLTKNRQLYLFTFWLHSVILKLVPCIALTLITGCLVRALYRAEERSARLKNGGHFRRPSAPPKAPDQDGPPSASHAGGSLRNYGRKKSHQPASHAPHTGRGTSNSRKRSTDRTTRLLIAILILFLLTEFPQGILSLLASIHGDKFFKDCYTPLGDVMDAMALTNAAINFILYWLMSKQFRKTFKETFHTHLWCTGIECSCKCASTLSTALPCRSRHSSGNSASYVSARGERDRGSVVLHHRADEVHKSKSMENNDAMDAGGGVKLKQLSCDHHAQQQEEQAQGRQQPEKVALLETKTTALLCTAPVPSCENPSYFINVNKDDQSGGGGDPSEGNGGASDQQTAAVDAAAAAAPEKGQRTTNLLLQDVKDTEV